jgi:Pentapeptide repeats (8 copies)
MLRRSQSMFECPVDPPTRQWIEHRWAWLLDEFGAARLRSGQVILPTAEFFPDEFSETVEGARALLGRVCGYMDIDPQAVELILYQENRSLVDSAGQHQGTAGLYEEQNGKSRIWIEHTNIVDPLALVATMTHELAHVHLLGQGRITRDVGDHEPLTDLLTVFLGMGVITANSVIREQYLRQGAYSAYRMQRQGYLSMPMYGFALALFARARGEHEPSWATSLRPDIYAAFSDGVRFLAVDSLSNHSARPAMPDHSRLSFLKRAAPEPVEEETQAVSFSAEELLARYAQGERDFRHLDLQGLCLRGAELRGIHLVKCDLVGVDLTDAILNDCNLRKSALQKAILCGANLSGSDLRGADFSDADLSGADLTNADAREADFTNTILRQTVLKGTLRDSGTVLSDLDLSDALCDSRLKNEKLQRVVVQRVSQVMVLLPFIGLVAVFGGVLGMIVAAALNAATGFSDPHERCKEVGAWLAAAWAAWSFFRPKSGAGKRK